MLASWRTEWEKHFSSGVFASDNGQSDQGSDADCRFLSRVCRRMWPYLASMGETTMCANTLATSAPSIPDAVPTAVIRALRQDLYSFPLTATIVELSKKRTKVSRLL